VPAVEPLSRRWHLMMGEIWRRVWFAQRWA